MSLLSYNRLVELVEQGVIMNVNPSQINSASIDLTLGPTVMVERPQFDDDARIYYPEVSLKKRTPLNMAKVAVDKGISLWPGEFILAQSEQVFNLPPTISAEYKLKSSMARIGLEHLNAGWCDAGWNGSVLTLELKNMTRYHKILLNRGVGIGQVVFFEHDPVPADRSYAARGRYNNDRTVSGIKE